MDGGKGELPLLFEAREVGEELADTGGLFEGGEVLEHLVDIQSLQTKRKKSKHRFEHIWRCIHNIKFSFLTLTSLSWLTPVKSRAYAMNWCPSESSRLDMSFSDSCHRPSHCWYTCLLSCWASPGVAATDDDDDDDGLSMLSRASAREMERDCDTPFTTSTSAP